MRPPSARGSRVRACMFLTLLLLIALFTVEARAQQPAKVHQLGYLSSQSPVPANRVEALRMGLRDLGYVEGKNIAIAFRPAETAERLAEAAADLVRLKVDVIFATSSTEVEAARRATKTIPIVFALTPTRSVSATWPALRGPAATSRGCRRPSPSSWSSNSR